MRKKDIVNVIYQNNEYLRKDLEDIVNQVFDIMADALINDEKVVIDNFGVFEKYPVAEYQGIHPITGEAITIASTHRIRFNTSKKLKRLIK